jgi:hypothetical protein
MRSVIAALFPITVLMCAFFSASLSLVYTLNFKISCLANKKALGRNPLLINQGDVD